MDGRTLKRCISGSVFQGSSRVAKEKEKGEEVRPVGGPDDQRALQFRKEETD